MRYIIALVLWIGLASLSAQESGDFIDVLYMKNGSEFRGQLLEYKADTVLFQTWSGVSVTVPMSTVEKIVQEDRAALKEDNGGKRKNSFSFENETLYYYTSLGVSADEDPGISMTQVVGYRWNRMASLGVGIGIENFELGWGRRIIPVFVESRMFLSSKNISPMLAFRAGYGFALRNEEEGIIDAKGGALFVPEVGFRFGGNTAQFTLSAALHFQWAQYTENWNDWGGNLIDTVDEIRYQRFEVKFGLLF